jgi:hypothetical protein
MMSDEPFYAPGRKIEPDRPAPRRVLETLWTVRKDQHVMTCIIVEAPAGEELRVLLDGEMYLTEIHTVHEGLIGRANTLHHALLPRGWTTGKD